MKTQNKIFQIKLQRVVLFAFGCLYFHLSIAQTTVTITVASGARQTFQGFGTSLAENYSSYASLTQTQRDIFTKLVWGDAHFKVLRLWFNPDKASASSGQLIIPNDFSAGYITDGVIADALKAGATTLLFAPNCAPKYMNDANGVLLDAYVNDYVTLLASAIKKIKDDYGVIINASGIMNEPNWITKQSQWTSLVKDFRTALDSRGLQNVKIVAPEIDKCNSYAHQDLDNLKADATAWSDLAGFATHSYDMAADDYVANGLLGTGKEYWNTESSANGPEASGDAFAGASAASRVLNDFNHCVTHWIWFLGYLGADPNDDQTRLIRYWTNPFKYEILESYYYLNHLSQAFDVGAVLRDANSSLEGDMLWTSGNYPALTVACGKNPDGSWAIGLSNYTANSFTSESWPNNLYGHTPAQTFNATIKINELATAGSMVMNVYRSNSNINMQSMGTVTMNNGVVVVNNVSSLDLITLRSVSGAAPSPNCTKIPTASKITDKTGTVWTLTSGQQVARNGIADASTGSVISLLYYNDTIYQENNTNNWWSWTGSTWTSLGTSPKAVAACTPSPDCTKIPAASKITDKTGVVWTLTSGQQIARDGIVDASTASVISLLYHNDTIYQENNTNNWWAWTGSTWTYLGTSPKASAACNTTGISNTTENSDAEVYPNPFTGNATLIVNSDVPDNYTIHVMDITGRIVYSSAVRLTAAKQNILLPLENINNGLYFLSVENGTIIKRIKMMKE